MDEDDDDVVEERERSEDVFRNACGSKGEGDEGECWCVGFDAAAANIVAVCCSDETV